MKDFLRILMNRIKTVGIDYLGEVVLGAVTEYRRSRREGHFDTFRKKENETTHDEPKYTPYEDRGD